MKARGLFLSCFGVAACFSESPSGTDGGTSSASATSSDQSSSASSGGSAPTTTSTADASTGGDTTTPTGDTGSTSDSGSSSTGAPVEPYTGCAQQDDPLCDGADERCLWTDGVADGTPPAGWCSQPCNEVGDCPPPVDGDAMVACTYYGTDLPLRCMLRCENGETCPTGMTCLEYMTVPEVDGYYTFVCAWTAE